MIQVCNIYSLKHVAANTLEHSCNTILVHSTAVKKIWTKLEEIRGTSPKALNFYSFYQLKVMNDFEASTFFAKKYYWFY